MLYEIVYYSARVQEDVLAFPVEILADFLRIAELLEEFGPELRLPHSRAMGNGLFELRPKGKEGAGRVLYGFLVGRRIVILHSFIKKSQKTPRKELQLAQSRLQEVKHAHTR